MAIEVDDAANANLAGALVARLRHAIGIAFDGDTELQRRARHLQTRCLIGIGGERLLLVVHDGHATIADRIPLLCSWAFVIRGRTQAWEALWQPVPKPGSHDLFALYKRGELQIEGDLQPLMANLQYFKDLLTLAREGATR